jgi:hypothetical protein
VLQQRKRKRKGKRDDASAGKFTRDEGAERLRWWRGILCSPKPPSLVSRGKWGEEEVQNESESKGQRLEPTEAAIWSCEWEGHGEGASGREGEKLDGGA